MFWECEHSNLIMESVAGPIISRMKCCLKSPRDSGPRLKMKAPQHLPVEPIRFSTQLIQPIKTVASRDLLKLFQCEHIKLPCQNAEDEHFSSGKENTNEKDHSTTIKVCITNYLFLTCSQKLN